MYFAVGFTSSKKLTPVVPAVTLMSHCNSPHISMTLWIYGKFPSFSWRKRKIASWIPPNIASMGALYAFQKNPFVAELPGSELSHDGSMGRLHIYLHFTIKKNKQM